MRYINSQFYYILKQPFIAVSVASGDSLIRCLAARFNSNLPLTRQRSDFLYIWLHLSSNLLSGASNSVNSNSPLTRTNFTFPRLKPILITRALNYIYCYFSRTNPCFLPWDKPVNVYLWMESGIYCDQTWCWSDRVNNVQWNFRTQLPKLSADHRSHDAVCVRTKSNKIFYF